MLQKMVHRWLILMCLSSITEGQQAIEELSSAVESFFESRRVSQVDMFLCGTYDKNKLLKNLSTKGLVTSLHFGNPKSPLFNADVIIVAPKLGIFLDMSCNYSREMLNWASANNVFSKGFCWLLYEGEMPSGSNVANHINLSLPLDSTIYISKSLHPEEIYHLLPNTGNIVNLSDDHRMSLRTRTRRKHNLQRMPIDIVLEDDLLTQTGSSTKSEYQKQFDAAVFQHIVELMNFRPVPVQMDTTRSSDETRGEWIMLEYILNGKAELGASSVTLTTDKLSIIDFSIAITTFRPQLYYKVESLRSARNVYVLPFSRGVWITIVAFVCTITVALRFILTRETRIFTTDARKPHLPCWELSEVMLITIGALCQQGTARDPVTAAARILFIALFVLAVLLYTAYSGSVVSLLSATGSVINTQQQIINDKMPVGAERSDYFLNYFKNETSEFAHELYHRKMETNLNDVFYRKEEGLRSVLQGDIAFIADTKEAVTFLQETLTEEEKCSIATIPIVQKSYYRAVPIRKSSPYKNALNYNILLLLEAGLINREMKRWFILKPLCEMRDAAVFNSIDMDDIYPALYLLGGGALASLVIFLLELFVYYSLFLRQLWCCKRKTSTCKKTKKIVVTVSQKKTKAPTKHGNKSKPKKTIK